MCVSVNLTVVYACVSYSTTRRTNLTGLLVSSESSVYANMCNCGSQANMEPTSTYGWSHAKTILIYSIAWLASLTVGLSLCHGYYFRSLPAVLVLTLFGIVVGSAEVVQNTNGCSCWCAPVLINVIPFAIPRQNVHTHTHTRTNTHIITNLLRGRLNLSTT